MSSTVQSSSRQPWHLASLALFSVGFRPFFLLSAVWAAIAVPVWLAAYSHGYVVPGSLPAMTWHAHEMVFGYGLATVAGFLLTAIPNWTGRPPLRGTALAILAALWLAGRMALILSSAIGPGTAAAVDLSLLATLIVVIGNELIAGRNWRNLPVVVALGLLLAANVLIHLQSLGMASTAQLGNRLGVATLLALISLIGGRIVPAFTRNWMARARPELEAPAPADKLDTTCLAAVVVALMAWVAAPESRIAALLELAGGVAAATRLARWRGLATLREPLLLVLHAGYAWLALGLAFMGLNGLFEWTLPGAPLHALTVGAIGTMTLAVMTRATLGHTGRPLTADTMTSVIYLFITLAAVLRIAAPLSGSHLLPIMSLAGVAWTAAFGIFLVHYGPTLVHRRAN